MILSPTTATTAALLGAPGPFPLSSWAVSDPVGSGFVLEVCSEPGGNVTGFINVEPTMAGKWLELLKEIAPRVERIAFLFNPATAPYAEYYLGPVQSRRGFAARAGGRRARIGTPRRSNPPSSRWDVSRMAASCFMPDTFLLNHRATAGGGVPAIYPFRGNSRRSAASISYGNDGIDNYRRAAIYADRILNGAKPSELPNTGASQVRVGGEPQIRQGARPRGASATPAARRRGDRIEKACRALQTKWFVRAMKVGHSEAHHDEWG